MAHLPFIHRNTIGKGGMTVVDGPGLLFRRCGLFRLRLQPPRRWQSGAQRRPKFPSQRRPRRRSSNSAFLTYGRTTSPRNCALSPPSFPSMARGRFYTCAFYQGFMRLPLLRSLVHAVGDAMNLVIAHQDRRVVNTQIPKADGSGSGELLFPAMPRSWNTAKCASRRSGVPTRSWKKHSHSAGLSLQ